jgi:hypothetical protein
MLEASKDGESSPFNPQTFLESTIAEFPKSLPSLPEFDDHTHGPSNPQPDYPNVQPYPNVEDNETSPLLNKTKAKAVTIGLWKRVQSVAIKATSFMNPPMWGGVLAIIAGLIPWLRKSLFNDSGALSAFEQSIENLGDLYTSLQTLILGSQLRSKAGHRPPVAAVAYLFIYRFFIVTAISCGLVVGSRKLLGDYIKNDPILVSTSRKGSHVVFVRRTLIIPPRSVFSGLYAHPRPDRTLGALPRRHRLHVRRERRDGLGRLPDLARQSYRDAIDQFDRFGGAVRRSDFAQQGIVGHSQRQAF